MTWYELRFLYFVVALMLLACAFSKSLTTLVIRFVFFSLLILFLVTIFYQS